jgi:hypothetical protein
LLCCVSFSTDHGQTASIEIIQKTCLKTILNENYLDYEAALEMTGLETMYSRRENGCLNLPLKSTYHNKNIRLFPHITSTVENVKESEAMN